MAAMLEIKNLSVSYGAIEALKEVNLSVEEGSIVAILGANGAGKSTLLRTISGIVKARSGSILLAGQQELLGMYPYKIAETGVIQSPEGRMILQGLTTEENLLVGSYSVKGAAGLSKQARINMNLERVFKLFPILKERRRQQANTLSGGEQQMLAMGRGLMSKPKLLMLDEPSMGLAPMLVEQIFAIIKEMNAGGTTILVVEQNAQMALSIADRAYVLETGRVLFSGSGRELSQSDEIKKAYLGG